MRNAAFVQRRDYKDSFNGTKNDSYQESNTNRFITISSDSNFDEDQSFLRLSELEKERLEVLNEGF